MAFFDGSTDLDRDEDEFQVASKVASLNAGYHLGFHPNTRSSVTCDLTGSFDRFFEGENAENGNRIVGSFALVADHYISPRLRFSARGNFVFSLLEDQGFVGSFSSSTDRFFALRNFRPETDNSYRSIDAFAHMGFTYALF